MINFNQERENAMKMWKESLLIISQLEQDLKVKSTKYKKKIKLVS